MTDQEMMTDATKGRQIERLQAIVARLRAPGGCPWDIEQTHASLIPNLIEEAYEVIDAIRKEDYPNLQEELGDLLLQVVFHSQIASEDERHDLDAVAQTVSDKLIRRHPHVFGNSSVENTSDVLTQWDQIKRQEKGEAMDLPYLHKVGEGLPALLAAQKLQKKASKVGFDWPDHHGVIDKIKEELQEVEEELARDSSRALEEELGDLLFSVVNLSRKLKKDPELLLHEANLKFQERFTQMERRLADRDLSLTQASLEQMERSWNDSK